MNAVNITLTLTIGNAFYLLFPLIFSSIFFSFLYLIGYENFVKERFERCLDLYLCPRKMKRRLNIDPETLVPRLPKPSELRPYPNSLCIQYLGEWDSVML